MRASLSYFVISIICLAIALAASSLHYASGYGPADATIWSVGAMVMVAAWMLSGFAAIDAFISGK